MAHETLKAHPSVYLLSMVIDPMGVHPLEDVLHAIAEKFETKYIETSKTGIIALNNTVSAKLRQMGNQKHHTVLWWSLPIEGVVEIYKDYWEVTWEKDDHTYSYQYFEVARVMVNSEEMELESIFWNEDKMLSFRAEMEVMFSTQGGTASNINEYFEQAWGRLEKGSWGDTWNVYSSVVLQLVNKFYELKEHSKEWFDALHEKAHWVNMQWYRYLWEQKRANKQEAYILGLQSFINRHKEAWLMGDTGEVMLKIYTPEHEVILKSLANEPAENYGNSLKLSILNLWKSLNSHPQLPDMSAEGNAL